MKFKSLSLAHRKVFDKYLSQETHEVSAYSFANIYIWKNHFKIFWQLIDENLCLFFQDKIGAFMYLPPLGKNKSAKLIQRCFEILDNFNENKQISRIENVEQRDLGFYRESGYECVLKAHDYVCKTADLVALGGNSFKSKRAAYNYFVKHYKFKVQPFVAKDKNECLGLYEQWMQERKAKSKDTIYTAMLEDGLICQKIALADYHHLGLDGIVVEVNQEIKGYTFGFKLNAQTFCVLFETCDLKTKGLAQYIFREFAFLHNDYKYINIMDDSGLENLKKVKLSYHPIKTVPSYIIQRKDE